MRGFHKRKKIQVWLKELILHCTFQDFIHLFSTVNMMQIYINGVILV